MKEWGLAIEGGILLGCVWARLAIALGVLFCQCRRSWEIWRRQRHAAVLGALALLATWLGGTKPPVLSVAWDEGLHNNSSYIYTNDLQRVHFAWTYDNWIPPRATVSIEAIEKDAVTTNMTLVATAPITDLSVDGIMERDVTNYLFWVSQSFIPDVPVVTNGVYHVHCVGGTNVWVPIGLTINENGRPVSPPHTFLNDLPGGNNDEDE